MLLQVKSITAGYGRNMVLDDLSLHVEELEIVSVIGPNGAGKSTLFNTIFGYIKPRQGRIIFDGEDITGLRPDLILKKGMSYVQQDTNVFTKMTTLENLEMGAYIRNDKEGIKRDIEKVYNEFPILRERRKQLAGTLSGGERRQLELGRALMLNPKLILLDEPSLGLERKYIEIVFEKLKELNERGITLLIIEQSAYKALSISDRGYVIDLGRARFEGSAKALLNDPAVKRLYLGG